MRMSGTFVPLTGHPYTCQS